MTVKIESNRVKPVFVGLTHRAVSSMNWVNTSCLPYQICPFFYDTVKHNIILSNQTLDSRQIQMKRSSVCFLYYLNINKHKRKRKRCANVISFLLLQKHYHVTESDQFFFFLTQIVLPGLLVG